MFASPLTLFPVVYFDQKPTRAYSTQIPGGTTAPQRFESELNKKKRAHMQCVCTRAAGKSGIYPCGRKMYPEYKPLLLTQHVVHTTASVTILFVSGFCFAYPEEGLFNLARDETVRALSIPKFSLHRYLSSSATSTTVILKLNGKSPPPPVEGLMVSSLIPSTRFRTSRSNSGHDIAWRANTRAPL